MELVEVSPKDIDIEDDRFRISYHFDLEKLLLSIKKIGIVFPLIAVARENSRYVLVSGWKRIFAAFELRLPKVPTYFLEENDDGRAFLFGLYENWTVRNFDILEKAEIALKLVGFIGDEKKVVEQFFPLLYIPATLSYLDMYGNIARLDRAWKRIVFDKKMPLPSVQLLTECAPSDRESLLPWIRPMNRNKLQQFLEDLIELGKRMDKSPAAILAAPEIQELSRAGHLSPLQKAERVRALIRRKRYPTLSSWKKSFDLALKKARLSRDVVFDAPSFFEDGEFAVTFSLKSKQDFQKRLARLQDLASDESLFQIFERFFDE